jgi:hypothetical protein
MLILVIGKLTRTEKKLITRIKNIVKERDNCQIRTIIIIHNLAQYHKKIEVENHINNSLKQSATFSLIEKKVEGIKEYQDRIYYVEEAGQGDIKVVHYILAKQGTEAGDYYNNLTLQLIKQKYNDCDSRKAINIPNEIVKLFSDLSSEITEEKIDSNQLEISEDKKTIKMKKDGNVDNQSKLIKLQNAYIDEFGDYKSNNSKFAPKYGLYVFKDIDPSNKRKKKLQNYLLLRLEIPGKIDQLIAKYYKNEKYKGILIKGKKSKEELIEKNKKDFQQIKDNRTFEDFEYFIELKGNYELTENYAEDFTEIYTFNFDKRNWEEEEENENNEGTNYSTELKEEKNEYISTIAGGIYSFKFKLSEASL